MPLALRGLWFRRWVSLAVLEVASLVVGAAATGPLFFRAAGESVLRDSLTEALLPTRVLNDHVLRPLSDDPLGRVQTASAEKVPQRPAVQQLFGPPVSSLVVRTAAAKVGQTPATVSLAYRDGVCGHVRVNEGICADDPGTVMVSANTLQIEGWRVGQQLTMNRVGVTVVGGYTPVDPLGDYWGENAYFSDSVTGVKSDNDNSLDAVFAPLATVQAQPANQVATSATDRSLDLSKVRLTDIPGLREQVTSYVASADASSTSPGSGISSSSLVVVLDQVVKINAALLLPVVAVEAQLLLLCWLVLFLLVANAAEARGPEVALAKLRALPAGRTVAFCSTPLVLVVLAVPAGFGLAWLLVRALTTQRDHPHPDPRLAHRHRHAAQHRQRMAAGRREPHDGGWLAGGRTGQHAHEGVGRGSARPGRAGPDRRRRSRQHPDPAGRRLPLPRPGGADTDRTRPARGRRVRVRRAAAALAPVATPSVLPSGADRAVLVDRDAARRAAGGATSAVIETIWLTSDGAKTVPAQLQAAGVTILKTTSAQHQTELYQRQGPELAILLFLVGEVLAAVLAGGGAVLNLYLTGRRRTYEIAAMSALRVRRRTLFAALAVEQGLLMGFGVVVGALSGLLAAKVALPSVPEFADVPAAPPLLYGIHPWPVLASLGVTVVVLAIVVAVSSANLVRASQFEQLREAAAVSSTPTPVVCENLTHTYRDDEGSEVEALRDVDLTVEVGQTVALVGPSGAGKSTLLTLLAGLVRPTSGKIHLAGQEVTGMSERALLRLRARHIGMVLQTPGRNVLPYATARENIAFAQHRRDGTQHDHRAEVAYLLGSVGLTSATDRAARLLSGGQQQRLALAVALAGRPQVLLADEPTSQLDSQTGDEIVSLLLAARDRHGTALVVVTHDHRVSQSLDVEYVINDGLLTGTREDTR